MHSYRTKVAEPISLPNREERERRLEAAGYNVFNLSSSGVFIDLLTDSGTGAMSATQWSALHGGDEAYAGSSSFDRLVDSVDTVMGFDRVVPAHQGRGAEHLLYGAILEAGDVVLNNTHFDTTRAHIATLGGEPIDCPSIDWSSLDGHGAFEGNFSLERAQEVIEEVGEDSIGCVIQTITNNSAAGQPVSLDNIEAVADLAEDLKVPFVIDACRFAENAYFNADAGESIAEVARAQFTRADAVVMSAKKDGLSNIGGFVAVRDGELFETIRQRGILFEGFPTYGGMAGRDIDAMAVGLREAVDRGYLANRIGQVRSLGERLADRGVPVISPFGGHAVYVDAGRLYDHLTPADFPGQALVCELYLQGGIRAVELGSLAFPNTNRPELVRLAIPRRMYHDEHLAHVVETFDAVLDARASTPGYEIVDAPGQPELRHFSATLEPTEA